MVHCLEMSISSPDRVHILAKHNVYPIAYNTGENAKRKHMGDPSFPMPTLPKENFYRTHPLSV